MAPNQHRSHERTFPRRPTTTPHVCVCVPYTTYAEPTRRICVSLLPDRCCKSPCPLLLLSPLLVPMNACGYTHARTHARRGGRRGAAAVRRDRRPNGGEADADRGRPRLRRLASQHREQGRPGRARRRPRPLPQEPHGPDARGHLRHC